jgi:regulatory protein
LDGDGLQSDGRFVETVIRSRAAKGYGVNRIRQDLRLSGIDDQGLEDRLRDYDWDELLNGVYAKKYGGNSPQSPREYAVRVRFLMQRGFTQSQIQALFKRLRQTHE